MTLCNDNEWRMSPRKTIGGWSLFAVRRFKSPLYKHSRYQPHRSGMWFTYNTKRSEGSVNYLLNNFGCQTSRSCSRCRRIGISMAGPILEILWAFQTFSNKMSWSFVVIEKLLLALIGYVTKLFTTVALSIIHGVTLRFTLKCVNHGTWIHLLLFHKGLSCTSHLFPSRFIEAGIKCGWWNTAH